MMSEKRFELSFDGKTIYDVYAVNKSTIEYDMEKACDLINSLYDENKQLKRVCELYSSATRSDREYIKELEEENEELRQQQQRLFNYFNDYLKDEIPVENFSEMWDNVKKV